MGASLVYDFATTQMVLFGGTNASAPMNDSWSYNGSTWTQLSPATKPSARNSMAMAYDVAAGTIVMFGGFDSGYNTLGDTWTYQPAAAVPMGAANVCSSGAPAPCSTSQTLLFTFASGGTIKAPAVLTQGVTGLDFTDAGTGTCSTNGTSHSYATGDTCTVAVSFAPQAPGRRLGAVELLNSTGSVLATALLSGTGIGPLGLFTTPSATTFAIGLSTPRGLTVDAAGNVYVSENGGTTLDKFTAGGVKTTYTVASGATGTAVDGAGNIFYGDGANIYKIAAGTTSSVLYATGVSTIDNDLQVDTFGNLYASSFGTNMNFYEFPAVASHNPVEVFAGGTSVSGGTTGRNIGTTIDANNNLFLADYNNARVYEVAAGTTTPVTLVSGNGISSPQGLTVDPAGNIYVENTAGATVRFNAPFSAGSAAHVETYTSLNGEDGAAMGGDGSLYVINGSLILKFARSAGPAITFPSTAYGASSAQTTEQFENDGNAVLTVASITASTSNFAAGSATANGFAGCGATVASAGMCGLGFKFTPQAVGTFSGSGIVTDNSGNVPGAAQTIPLAGTATQATQTITFPQPAAGVTGVPATLTATSTSGLAVTFSITGGTGSATLSGTNNSTITYTGVGTVQITASQAGNADYAAAATVTDTVTVTAGSIYTAPTTAVATTSATQVVSVKIATGGKPTAINVLTQGSTGLDYALVSGGTCTTASTYTSGQSCTVKYSFTPKAPGLRLGAVQLVAGTTTLGTSLLSGTGNGPAVVFPQNTSTVAVGSGLNEPRGVAVDAAGDVFEADGGGNSIKEIVAVGGVVSSSSTTRTIGYFSSADSMAVDGAGNVFVAGDQNGAVYEIVAATGASQAITSASYYPYGVAVDQAGDVFFSDDVAGAVYEIVAVNGVVSTSSTVVTISTQFSDPQGIAVDASGDIFVADYGNSVTKEIVAVNGVVSSSSTVKTVASISGASPVSVAVDAIGDLYIADYGSVVEVIAVNGVVSTSSAQQAVGGGYNTPFAAAVDGSGRVYVADYFANAMYQVQLLTPPAETFASTPVGTTSSDSPRSVTLQNVGNSALTISSTTATGPFSVSAAGSAPCGSSLASGVSCNVGANFSPTSIGSASGTLVITDNELNAGGSTQTGQLSGTATIGSQTITFPQPLSPVLSGYSTTLTATGGASGNPVTYTVSNGTGAATLSGPNNSTITYGYAGGVQITASQAGNANYSAATSVTRGVQIISANAPAPPTAVGSVSATQTAFVKISVAGTPSSINLLTQGVAGLDYTYVSGGSCSTSTAYTVGQVCTVMYTFAPKGVGRRPGAVTLLGPGGTLLGTGLLYGKGIGPLGLFNTPVATTVATGLNGPLGLSVDVSGNVYVNESNGTTLDKFTPAGVETQYTVPTGSTGTAVDGAGNIYFGNGNSIYEILAGTTTPVVYSSGVGSADNNLQIDMSGNLFVTDMNSHALYEIYAISPQTAVVRQSGGQVTDLGYNTGRLVSTAIDPDDNLFLLDYTNSGVIEMTAQYGAYEGLFNLSPSTIPYGLTVDPAGNLYVMDLNGAANVSRYTPPFNGGAAAYQQTYPAVYGRSGGAVGPDGTLYTIDGTNIDKYVRTSTPALSFGSVADQSSSAQALEEFENDGNAALAISSIAASNSNFVETGVGVNSFITACGSSLPVAGLCGLGVTFTPQSTGTLTGYGDVTDNTVNVAPTVQAIALSGTGTQIGQTITFPQPATPVLTGTTETLTATATSGLAVTYSVLSGSATISGSTVTFTGGGTVVLAADQPGNATYTAAPEVTVSVTVQGGHIWLLNANGTKDSVYENGSAGMTAIGAAGTSSTLGGIAIDHSGSVWSVTSGNNYVFVTNSTGSQTVGYAGGGLSAPVAAAVDGTGSIWIANSFHGSVSVFSNSGTAVSGTNGYAPGYSGYGTGQLGTSTSGIAIDNSGGVWVTSKSGNSVTHIVGAAGPVTTPTASAVVTNGLGVEP